MRLFILGLMGMFLFCSSSQAAPALKRVNKANAIRCGYVEYNPALMKDAKTNK